MKVKEFFRETRRLALLGILAGYVFLAFHILSSWVIHGSPSGWDPLVSGFSGIVRNVTALLFFYPAISFVSNLVIGAAASFVIGFTVADEEKRRKIGVIVVVVVSFAILGLPARPLDLFRNTLTGLGYLGKLLVCAGFVWAVRRWEKQGRILSHITGFILIGVTLLWFAFTFLFPRNFSPTVTKRDHPPGPNIVVFLTDAYRADAASLYGGHVPTPNLERLAEVGVVYERCFAPSSWTIPSVTAIFTGLAPEVSGMDGIRALPSSIEYLPERLSEYGYRTWTSIGNRVLTRSVGFYRGFGYYSIYDWNFFGQGFLYDSWSSFYGKGTEILCNFLLQVFHEYVGRMCPDEGLEMLSELNSEGGDFVYIHILDPHTPYQPPQRHLPENDYQGRYQVDSLDFTKHADDLTDRDLAQLKLLYEGEVRYVDEYLGKALDILEEGDLWQNTAFIFLSDHGEEFREHGRLMHKTVNLHHELTHVPLVIYWPGLLEGGGVVSEPVSLADIYPTVLDALNLKYIEDKLNARSLLTQLPKNRPIFAQRCWNDPPGAANSDFVILGEAALFVNHDEDIVELYLSYYDRPVNQAKDRPEIVAELEKLIEEWHVRNEELIEYHDTIKQQASPDQVHVENLRALGYLQ